MFWAVTVKGDFSLARRKSGQHTLRTQQVLAAGSHLRRRCVEKGVEWVSAQVRNMMVCSLGFARYTGVASVLSARWLHPLHMAEPFH